MKRNKFLRLCAFLCAFVMFVTLLPVLSTESKAATYTYNAGTRHTVATTLTSQAQAYYTGSYSYSTLSALSGSASDPMNSALFTALHNMMTNTMTGSVSYSSLTSYWPYSDASGGSAGTLLFYSDQVSGSFNREHVWPKSRASYYQTNGGSDLHHLRPTNSNVNSTRGNYTMGNVKGVLSSYSTYSYGGSSVLYYNASADNGLGLVEVNDNIKGDVARVLLYVYVRWQQPNLYNNVASADLPTLDSDDNADDGNHVIESLATLLQWMAVDPVDTWETGRNDVIQNIQGNRNVFIDYPELAWQLFGQTVPADYQTPSGGGSGATATPTDEPTDTSTPTPTPTPTPASGAGEYQLVKSADTLQDGDKILAVGQVTTAYYAMDASATGFGNSAQSIIITDYMGSTADADLTIPTTISSNTTTDSHAFTLTASGTYWLLGLNHDTLDYLTSTSSDGTGMSYTTDTTDEAAQWSISYTNQLPTVQNRGTSRVLMMNRNNSNPYFRVYGTSNSNGGYSSTATTQYCLFLYRYVAGTAATDTPTPTPTDTPTPNTATLSFIDTLGGGTTTDTAYEGESYTLPAATSTSLTINGVSYSFLGWTSEQISAATTELPTYFSAGSSITVSGDASYYALYSYTVGGNGSWVQLTNASELTDGGQYALVSVPYSSYTTYYLMNSTIVSTNYWGGTAIGSYSGDFTVGTVTAASVDDDCVWTASELASGVYGFVNSSGVYLATNSSNSGSTYKKLNTAASSASASDNYSCWSIDSIDAYRVKLASAAFSGYYMSYAYRYSDFCCYASDNSSSYVSCGVYLLRKLSGTNYYLTGEPQQTDVYYTLTLDSTLGGSLSVTDGDKSYATGATVLEGIELTVNATPATGYELISLTVNGEEVESGSVFLMEADTVVSASFALIPTYQVSVSIEGGGDVSLYDGDTILTPGAIMQGMEIRLAVSMDEGYTLTSLTVNGTAVSDGYVFVLDADTVISAVFTCAHNWGAWTSNNDGTHSRICSVCGEKETADCTYTDVVTAPTCTAQGYTTHTCTVCGYVKVDTYVNALDHTWGAWTSNGNDTHSRTCSVCGETEDGDCDYVRDTSRDAAPTATETGIEAYTCSVCGAHRDVVLPATGWTVTFVKASGETVVAYNVADGEILLTIPTVPASTAAYYAYWDVDLKNVSIKQDYTVTAKYRLWGDVNNDGSVTITDISKLQRYIVGLEELDAIALAVGDVNEDGGISVADVSLIQKYILNLGTLPVPVS